MTRTLAALLGAATTAYAIGRFIRWYLDVDLEPREKCLDGFDRGVVEW